MQNFIRAVQILLLSKLWGPGPPRLDICINHKIFTRARLHPLDIERQFINKILFFKILVSYIQWWRPDREQRTTERTTQRPRNRETLPWTLNRSRRGHNPIQLLGHLVPWSMSGCSQCSLLAVTITRYTLAYCITQNILVQEVFRTPWW